MTISEIAKLAGVSNAAVSRYLNNGYVSEEKRRAIKKVVEETGYRPSLQAQTLRTKRTKMIGVIVPQIDSSSVGRMVAGITSVLEENGYRLLLAVSEQNSQKELEYLILLNEKQVDGVILFATVLSVALKKKIKQLSVPVVLTGQHLSGCNCVYHDDYHAMYDVTKLVLSKGCRNFCYIGVTNCDRAVGAERFRGFQDALAAAGMLVSEESAETGKFTVDSGYEKMKKLYKKYPNVDAVICATDEIAVGAMQYLKQQGKKIGMDVLLTGQGDSVLAANVSPSLTTIHYYYEECGSKSAQMILELLEKGTIAVQEIKLGYELVEHESSNNEFGR
ncbi:LacI family transcriptional regulator [bacterium D16-51]|nr:LacI family transcriptional regulator [bacterium D16-59]RKI59294.1 LacI family transcriptional regulator [bacterium D16-51]